MKREWAVRLGLALCAVAALNLTAAALAHPSDYSTLTLDLLFGTDGLEAIDAAVVESEAGAYEPFPSDETKHRVAATSLRALGIPEEAVRVDVSGSPLYHQVGFLILLDDPSFGVSRSLRVATPPLWEAVSDLGLGRLKLSVCGVGDSLTTPDGSVLDDVQLRASHDGRNPQGLDRAACTVWEVAGSGDAVQIEVGSTELPETGLPAPFAVATAMGLILLGAGARAVRATGAT